MSTYSTIEELAVQTGDKDKDFLNKIKLAYLEYRPETLDYIHGVLVEFFDSINDKMTTFVFCNIGIDIVSKMIAFGINDTEVREEIYTFIQSNIHQITPLEE